MTTAVLTYPELEHLEGGSAIKGSTQHIGQQNRNTGKPVRFQIYVNCTVQNGGESTARDHAVALHEIPLLRKRYGLSGSVQPRPHWVSGVARAQGLSESAFREEEQRLKQAYGDTFTEIYGGANGIPPCMGAKVAELTKAWNEMQERCKALDRRITAEDINQVIATIEPKEEFVEPLEELSVGDAETATKKSGPTIDGALLQLLADNDVPEDKATAFAQEIAAAGGPALTDEAWARIPGVGNHKQRRDKLLRVYETHVGG